MYLNPKHSVQLTLCRRYKRGLSSSATGTPCHHQIMTPTRTKIPPFARGSLLKDTRQIIRVFSKFHHDRSLFLRKRLFSIRTSVEINKTKRAGKLLEEPIFRSRGFRRAGGALVLLGRCSLLTLHFNPSRSILRMVFCLRERGSASGAQT